MLAHKIKFADLDGNPVEDTFYFHLNKMDLVELQLDHPDGIEAYFRELVKTNDNRRIYEIFRKFITMSVGRRSENGREFIKDEAITNAFVRSEAFSELILQMIQDSSFAAKFMVEIMPADLQGKAREVILEEAQPKQYSDAELQSMSDDEFYAAVGSDPKQWNRSQLAMAMERKSRTAA